MSRVYSIRPGVVKTTFSYLCTKTTRENVLVYNEMWSGYKGFGLTHGVSCEPL